MGSGVGPQGPSWTCCQGLGGPPSLYSGQPCEHHLLGRGCRNRAGSAQGPHTGVQAAPPPLRSWRLPVHLHGTTSSWGRGSTGAGHLPLCSLGRPPYLHQRRAQPEDAHGQQVLLEPHLHRLVARLEKGGVSLGTLLRGWPSTPRSWGPTSRQMGRAPAHRLPPGARGMQPAALTELQAAGVGHACGIVHLEPVRVVGDAAAAELQEAPGGISLRGPHHTSRPQVQPRPTHQASCPTAGPPHVGLDDAPGVGEPHVARGAVQVQALLQIVLRVPVDLQGPCGQRGLPVQTCNACPRPLPGVTSPQKSPQRTGLCSAVSGPWVLSTGLESDTAARAQLDVQTGTQTPSWVCPPVSTHNHAIG